MDPVVLVQVLEQQSRHAAEMVTVCTTALRRGTCQLASPKHVESLAPRAVAVVSWKDRKHESVLIEVGKEIDGEKRWLARSIDFQPQDAIGDRWRVVGLTVATLVGDLEDAQAHQTLGVEEPADALPAESSAPPASPDASTAQPASLAPPAPPLLPAPTPSKPRRAATESRKSVTAGARPKSENELLWAVAACGSIDPLTPRFGGLLRETTFPERRWFATVALSYSARPKDDVGLQMSWAGLSTGGGLRVGVPGTQLQSRYRLELVVERISASAYAPEGREHDESARFIAAARGGIGLEWPLGRHVGLVGGLDATLYAQPVRVRSAGSQIAAFPQATLTLNAGLSVRF
ncbi:MAG: hypothetical protein QM784_17635 [Polyangiaceae bacterium]